MAWLAMRVHVGSQRKRRVDVIDVEGEEPPPPPCPLLLEAESPVPPPKGTPMMPPPPPRRPRVPGICGDLSAAFWSVTAPSFGASEMRLLRV